MTWSKICWTSKVKVTGPLPWFNNSHKEYISLSYWSVNADKKGWGSVISTLLYCSTDGNPGKKDPFWYTSALFLVFWARPGSFCSFRAYPTLEVHRAVLSQFSSPTVTLPLSSLLWHFKVGKKINLHFNITFSSILISCIMPEVFVDLSCSRYQFCSTGSGEY